MDPTRWDAPFPVIAAALFVIVMARANGTYWLGRLGASGARRTRLGRAMESPGYERATRRINEYGAPVITLSFLTIGFQTLANLAAGATRMPMGRYLPAVTVGAVLWALLYATLGTVGVDLFGRLWSVSPLLAIGSLVAVGGGFVWYVMWRHGRLSAG
jgi:membrane protein DedA with SNARE-associated domain